MRFRSGNADLAKFIASCLIMTYHIFIFGLRNYHFGTAWIYVEFFLIITGFFTARHFSTVKTEEPMKIAIRYTINKFLPLIPYTTIATVLMYLLLLVPLLVNGQLNFEEFLLSFTTDMPFDLLLISDAYAAPLVAPLWYLSALIVVFPIFCYLLLRLDKYQIMVFSALYFILYYSYFGINGECAKAFLRMIAGLAVGSFLFELSVMYEKYIKNISKSTLTIVELMTFAIPIYLTFSLQGNFRFIVLNFSVCLLLMLSNTTYTSLLSGRICSFLGKLSMPIFIIHWVVGKYIIEISNFYKMSIRVQLMLYYLLTILFSVMIMWIVGFIKNRKRTRFDDCIKSAR